MIVTIPVFTKRNKWYRDCLERRVRRRDRHAAEMREISRPFRGHMMNSGTGDNQVQLSSRHQRPDRRRYNR